jgi:hypothetical protein
MWQENENERQKMFQAGWKMERWLFASKRERERARGRDDGRE